MEVDRVCLFKLVFVIIKLDGWSGIFVVILVLSKVELCGRDLLEKVVFVDDFFKLNGICELDNVLEVKLLEYWFIVLFVVKLIVFVFFGIDVERNLWFDEKLVRIEWRKVVIDVVRLLDKNEFDINIWVDLIRVDCL